MTWVIPTAGIILALFAAYIAVRAETRYTLRYLLIASVAAFGVVFYVFFPRVLGRPSPLHPKGDFHMIAMTEHPDHFIEMWVQDAEGSRLYRFKTTPVVLQQLRGMTDGNGRGIFAVIGNFSQTNTNDSSDLKLDIRRPDSSKLPEKRPPVRAEEPRSE